VVVGAARYPRISHGSNMGVIMQPNGTKSESGPDLSLAVRTLLSGGFILSKVQRAGLRAPSRASARRVRGGALLLLRCFRGRVRHRAEPVLVGQGIAEMPNLEWASFVSLFGGPILRVCANRRVAYVSRGSQKAVQSL
jgi:hypothetical protein